MDYQELFTGVEAFLSERGYNWVCQQVREELTTGKLTKESISTLAEVNYQQTSFIERADFKRGQPAEFVRRAEYSDKEALVLLLEAARRAIFESIIMESEVAAYLAKDEISALRFEPEEDSEAALVLKTDSTEISSISGLMHELDGMISQVRRS